VDQASGQSASGYLPGGNYNAMNQSFLFIVVKNPAANLLFERGLQIYSQA
jgi:hypothetical protein